MSEARLNRHLGEEATVILDELNIYFFAMEISLDTLVIDDLY